MKRVTLVVVTFALALALTFLLSGALTASPQNLSADSTITNLRMSAAMGGPAKVNFLPGTQTVYASFDYANSGGTLIGTLTVEDDLATIFQNSRSYTGSGTQTFMIRGTDVFTAYLNGAYSNGVAMTSYITQAQGMTSTYGITQTVQMAINEGSMMQAKLLRAQNFNNTSACLTAIVAATTYVTWTLSEGQTIMGLTDLAQMQSHLTLMRGYANNATTYTQQAIANADGNIQNAFPNTPPCGWRYNTSASADTGGGPSVADSVEWTVGTPGVPVQISLEAKPSSIPSSSTSAVKATVKDSACIVVADGTSINFSTSAGSISPGSTSTTNGMANAVFTAPAQVGRAVITAVAGSAQMTTTVSYGLAQVLLSAFPMTIPVNGGMSELSIELRDASGANIGYDVPVTLTTTLGKFLQSGSNVYNTTASYGHGNATLVAESQAGIAVITVNAGTALATTTVAIVAPNPPTPTPTVTITHAPIPTDTPTRTPTATPTQTPTHTPSPTRCVTLSLQPSSRTVNIGDIFTFDVRLDAGTASFDTASLDIHFDPGTLVVVDSSGNPSSSIQQGNLNSTGSTVVTSNSVDNTAGTIAYTEALLGHSQTGGTFTVATIRFKAKQAIPGTPVTFANIGNTASPTFTGVLLAGSIVAFCAGSPTGATVIVAAPTTATPTPTSTPTPTRTRTPTPTSTPTNMPAYVVYLPLIMKDWLIWVPATPTPTATVTPRPTPNLKSLVTEVTLTLPQPLAEMSGNWCTWGGCSLSPRLYHEPLSDGRTLVGWTDSSGNGHVSVIGNSGSLDQTYDFPALSVRGMVAHDDGKFAILLWNSASKIMWLSKRNTNGGEIWTTNIDGSLTSFNSGIGDSRLTYGNGLYAAYFAVHGDTGWPQGHEGDQLTYVGSNGTIQSGGWDWGCSHSMAELVNYHPTLNKFVPACSSDCYASKGILLNDNQVVYQCDGNCGGLVSAQLGQIALSGNSWKLVFNALNRPGYGYVGKGIGLATIDGSFQSSYVWLTNTNGDYERDPVIARLGSNLQSNRYVVGWKTTNDGVYWLGVIDGSGSFLTGPEEVSSAGIAWGNRDDSFRTRADGDVSWVQGNPTSTALHMFRFNGSTYIP